MSKDTRVSYSKVCPACKRFFAKYRCAASTCLECDCPRCQGHCTCVVTRREKKTKKVGRQNTVEK
jgi:hypothetical protein